MEFHSEEEIFGLISVRPPYFALEGVSESEGSIRAKVPYNEISGAEVGPISAAEAARHMAILGSYAASLFNDRKGRHYYLAKRGEIQSFNYLIKDEPLFAEAKGKVVSKQEAIATVELVTTDGEVAFSAEVTYQVIPKKIFERIFGERRIKDELCLSPSDLISGPYPLYQKVYSEDSKVLTASLGQVKPEYCVGHFDNYPCLPIAFLLSTMAKASGDFLARVIDRNIKYVVRDAVSNAEYLAFAGDNVDIKIEYMGNYRKNCHSFKCIAHGEDKVYGDLYINLMEVVDVDTRKEPESENVLELFR